jgi:hypothetical protein
MGALAVFFQSGAIVTWSGPEAHNIEMRGAG